MPVGTKPITNNFVQRNRIIAGLAERLILGEADLKSGSMTTANFAIGYGRSVFAVPSHPSDGRSVGPNKLIKEGKAILCTGITDFFEEKKETETEKIQSENYLLDRLGTIPVSESVLAQFVKKPIAEIKTDLIILELQGFVKKQNGGYIKI
jgi:DNA processing protein